MPDLSPNELNALRDLMLTVAPNLAIALSEQVNRDLTLENPEIVAVPIQDLLFSTDEVVQTVFSLSPPFAVESLFLFTTDAGRVFVDLMEGGAGAPSVEPLTEKQNEALAGAMTGLAQGLAIALSNVTGIPLELEANSAATGTISLPPVFAMDGVAIQARYTLTIPDLLDSTLTYLFTPELVRLLVPQTDDETPDGFDNGGGQIIGEDDLAAMLSGLSEESGMDAPGVALGGGGGDASPGPFSGFSSSSGSRDSMPRGLELIMDIPLDVTVELGRVRMLIKDVLELASGSIIELDRVAGEPVDLLVNGRLIAKGEVVVIEDNFGIRITEIISPTERVAGLGKGR